LDTISASQREEIEAAIRRVFEDGCASWNHGDLDGYLASYWDSDKTIWISGGRLSRGKDAIVAVCKARFATDARMGELTVADLEIDVLTPIDAIVLGRWILKDGAQLSTGYFTVQLKKIAGNWVYISDHASTST